MSAIAWSTGSGSPGSGPVDTSVLQLKLVDRGMIAVNTAYAVGDVLTYRGRRILMTTAANSGATAFLSFTTYIPLGKVASYNAFDFGYRADGATGSAAGNTGALQQAINTAFTDGGGLVEVPYGFGYINATIELKRNVWLRGQGVMGTQIVLAPGSNCTMVKTHVSTGSGDANAFFCGIADLTLDGRKTTQSAGAWHGVDFTTNPLNTGQAGDPFFDPHHVIRNVRIYTCAGDGVRMAGRAGHEVTGVVAIQNDGYGFYTTFDTLFTACQAAQSGLAGFHVHNGQVQLANCKSFLNGLVTPAAGHGFHFASSGLAVATATGCNAQNNQANGFYFNGCSGVSATGCGADSNNAANAGYVGYAFDSAAKYNVLSGTASQTPQAGASPGAQSNALSLTGGADFNDITITHYGGGGQTVGAALKSGSTIASNRAFANGAAL